VGYQTHKGKATIKDNWNTFFVLDTIVVTILYAIYMK
jgi:hypothetical protein